VDRDNAVGAIGYWLDLHHHGRGVMTAAVHALVRHGFDELQLHRVEIRTDVLNRSSRAVAERLGFRLEGVLRESYRISDECYSDDAVYSMLASDGARQALAASASGA
jgi:ribosomal-protein-serine acetyltransferase